jgi:hypothetical protein
MDSDGGQQNGTNLLAEHRDRGVRIPMVAQ